MIGTGMQSVYNLNSNQIESQYSKAQSPYEDTTCDEMLLYRGTSRRATGIYKTISAMKQFTDSPIDELRVNIYACTGNDTLECVYSNVEKGFQEPSNISQQQQATGGNFLTQNTNQNLFGTTNNNPVSQSNMLGGLSNNQILNTTNTGNTLFAGIGNANGSFSNTNTMSSNILGNNLMGSGGTGNTNLLQQSGTNLLGANALSNQVGASNLFQSGSNVGSLQSQNLFQGSGSSFNTAVNTNPFGQTNSATAGGLTQPNQFKTPLNANTNALDLQAALAKPIGGGIGGLTGGIGTTNNLFDNKNNNLLLQKPSTISNQSGGGLLGQVGTATTSISGGAANKGLFTGMGQMNTGLGTTNITMGNSNALMGRSTNSNSLLPSGGFMGGTGSLQNTATNLSSGGGLLGNLTSNGGIGLTNPTVGGGLLNTGTTIGTAGGGLGLFGNSGIGKNTTGLQSGNGLTLGGTTTNTSSLLQPTATASLGLGTTNLNSLGLTGGLNTAGSLTSQAKTSVPLGNNLLGTTVATINPVSTLKPGQRTFTLSTQQTGNINNLVVDEEELLEFRRQRQLNRYVDSMRNFRKSPKRETQLNDTSIIQSTSKTSDKILFSGNAALTKSNSIYKSSIANLPTNFSQISRMYTNKGLSNIYHHYSQQNGARGKLLPNGNNMNKLSNFFFEKPTVIEVGDETTKLVRNALIASRKNSVLNRSDTLPLVNIKTDLDESIRYPRSAIKRQQEGHINADLESTRCDRCSRSYSSVGDSVQTSLIMGNNLSMNNSRIYCCSCAERNDQRKAENTSNETTSVIATPKKSNTSKRSKSHRLRVTDGYSTSSSSEKDHRLEKMTVHSSCSSSSSVGLTSVNRASECSKNQKQDNLADYTASHQNYRNTVDVDPSSYGMVTVDKDENVDIDYRPKKSNITLVRPDYYTKPTLSELDEMCTDGRCVVKGFVVGRKHYGFATFPDEIDVFGLNLDEIVIFNRALVEIYPDDYPNKPPQDQGLNRRAIITLYNVFPYDLSENGGIVKDIEILSNSAYIETMENLTLSLGALFLDYNPIDGTWTFEVPHFTKYGLDLSRECGGSSLICSEHGNAISILSKPESSFSSPNKSNNQHSLMNSIRNKFLYNSREDDKVSNLANNGNSNLDVLVKEGSIHDVPTLDEGLAVNILDDLKVTQTLDSLQGVDHDDSVDLNKFCIKRKRHSSIGLASSSSSGEDQVFIKNISNIVNPAPSFKSLCRLVQAPSNANPNKYHNTLPSHNKVRRAFPQSLVTEYINRYPYQPSMFVSTQPFESSSTAFDNSKALVKCFIKQQSHCDKVMLSVGNNFIVKGKPVWDVAQLFRSSSHIGCSSYTIAYIQPRSLAKNCTQKDNITSLTPQMIHVTRMKQDIVEQNYIDSKTLNHMFHLLGRFSTQQESFRSNDVAPRYITSKEGALIFIDELVDFISQSTVAPNCYLEPLFILMKILFVGGKRVVDHLTPSNISSSLTSTNEESHRKNKLLEWTKKMSHPAVVKAVRSINTEYESDPYKAVKVANCYIASQRCNEATDILSQSNFNMLALVSTLVHADSISKYRVGCQIDKWRQNGAINEVGDDVLTLLSIVSGTNSYPAQYDSNDKHNSQCLPVDSSVNEETHLTESRSAYYNYPYWVNFDWVSAFSLFLFNYSKSDLTIKTVFKCFATATERISKEYSHCKLFNELGEDSLTRFFSKLTRSLLYLYCGNGKPFNELVDEFVVLNESYSPTIPIIWLVVILLNRIIDNSPFSNLLLVTVTTRFSELLENCGQWERSIFVLNFIDSLPAYHRQIQDIMMRNFYSLRRTEFLHEYNLIPFFLHTSLMCPSIYLQSYPFEDLKALQEIICNQDISLKNDLTRGGLTDVLKYASIIEMVLYRLAHFNARSHSDNCVIDEIRRICTSMFIAINNMTLNSKLKSNC